MQVLLSMCFADADKPIHLALLMPFTGFWPVALKTAGAAALAVERVNADKALLGLQRRLEYSWADSGCSAQQGLKAMGALELGKKDAVIGPGCSAACKMTSYLAGGQGLPQLSFGCTSPELSLHDEFPLVSLGVISTSW